MTAEEIKLKRLARQHLTAPAEPLTVVRDLCGVQAQFLSSAIHAIRIRGRAPGEADLAALVKSWTIRGTVHVFAREDLPLFLHRGRRHFLRPCDTLETDDRVTGERKRYFADLILEQIGAGTDTREALKERCFAAGMTEREAESLFDPWGGIMRALCEQGSIAYQVREKKSYLLCPPFTPMEEDEARLELARRYFTHFGPATVRDAAYFFGATQTQVKAWLARLPVTEAVCQGRSYFSIGDEDTFRSGMPECIFLAGFDQLMLGYEKTESLFLPQEHLRDIFSLAGIVSPALLLHGSVAGKWKKTGTKVSITLFEAVSPAEKRLIETQARALWPGLRRVEVLGENR